ARTPLLSRTAPGHRRHAGKADRLRRPGPARGGRLPADDDEHDGALERRVQVADAVGPRGELVSPSMASTRLTRDVPGMSGFDPEHTARVVAWLAAPGCPVNGQVLAVRGTTVTLLDGWRAGRSVTGDDGPWTVAELTEAM